MVKDRLCGQEYLETKIVDIFTIELLVQIVRKLSMLYRSSIFIYQYILLYSVLVTTQPEDWQTVNRRILRLGGMSAHQSEADSYDRHPAGAITRV